MELIRTAKSSDAQGIATVHVETWQEAYKGIIPDAYLESLSVDAKEANWRHSLEDGKTQVLVAELNSQLIGWIAFGPSRDDNSASESGEIEAIYVLADFWSTGVGKKLWLKAIDKLVEQGFTSVSLWVLTENIRAIDFYLKAGLLPESGRLKEIEISGKTLKEIRYSKKIISQYNPPDIPQ